jgi:2-oxoglutarate dehydrogenase E2 component (dihydrolipoamide succinyltransferase)
MDIKIPEVGESIHEALIAQWLKEDGASVVKDEVICELETDKINVELEAEASGRLQVKIPAGETVQIGTLIGIIEEGVGVTPEPIEAVADTEPKTSTTPEEPAAEGSDTVPVNPAARRAAREQGVDLKQVAGSGRQGRVTLDDIINHEPGDDSKPDVPDPSSEDGRPVTREAMTPIRQRIAARLLEARQQTAMLTTFNEADMSQVKTLRAKHQEHFTARHGIKLGLMSIFVKACIAALKQFPTVNARIDGQEIVYHHYYDVGIAVGTERGLVVPVLRDADQLTFAEIEQQIATLAEKANARKLTLAELEGGTFTISNGGIYGSLLSTPIINPPQCGVLGMHSIQDQAVVRDDDIVIRPIMNLALSYDHRLIDGREAVGFLKLIKEYIEDPEELMLEL